MKRIILHATLAVAVVSLFFITVGPASAQMGGRGQMMGRQAQMGQGQTQEQAMPMHQNMQSMQAMRWTISSETIGRRCAS
jgi:hypothetical protein